MLRLSPTLLVRPPEEVCRLLALDRLHAAVGAARRLARGTGNDELHSFRVALRRLRSIVRSYRPFLRDRVKKKAYARLKRLARSTGGSRDAEVELKWLRRQEPKVHGPGAYGWRWMRRRLKRRLLRSDGARSTASASALRPVIEPLRGALAAAAATPPRRDARYEFRHALAALLSELGAGLRYRMQGLDRGASNDKLHSARLAAKQLRYVFELPAALFGRWSPLLEELKMLQEALGQVNDLHVLRRALRAEKRKAASDEPQAVPGLQRLITIARKDHERALASLERTWLEGRALRLLDRLDRVSAALSASELPR